MACPTAAGAAALVRADDSTALYYCKSLAVVPPQGDSIMCGVSPAAVETLCRNSHSLYQFHVDYGLYRGRTEVGQSGSMNDRIALVVLDTSMDMFTERTSTLIFRYPATEVDRGLISCRTNKVLAFGLVLWGHV